MIYFIDSNGFDQENEIISLLSQLPSLKGLNLSSNGGKCSIAVIDTIVSSNTKLEYIEFGCGISLNSAAIRRISNLKSLKLVCVKGSDCTRFL